MTVTVNEQLAVLPLGSVAVAFTVVVPTGNVDPDGGVATTLTGVQLSVAVTLKLTTAEHRPVSLLTVMFVGHVITGGVTSVTVTVNEQLEAETLPEASVAVQLTEVVPTGNADPVAGVQDTVAPGQLSLAVAVKLTTAEH